MAAPAFGHLVTFLLPFNINSRNNHFAKHLSKQFVFFFITCISQFESQASFSREEPDEIKTNANAMLTGWKEKVGEHERENASHLRHVNAINFVIRHIAEHGLDWICKTCFTNKCFTTPVQSMLYQSRSCFTNPIQSTFCNMPRDNNSFHYKQSILCNG